MKDKISRDQMYEIHPRIPLAHKQLEEGRITRREFVRFATLLGMSATLAVACAPADEGSGVVEDDGDMADNGVPKRGGMITIGMATDQIIDHPARLSWIEGSNVVRQVCENLTQTNPGAITVPLLLESWEANDTVDQWTLKLREGILFNDGSPFNADTVLFNFGEWLNPEVGSSMLGLLGYLDGDIGRVEKVDDLTVRLNLARPEIGVPENLFHYPSAIMKEGFGGDFIKEPIGTGPFTLEDYVPGERIVLKARSDYWGKSEDGSALPYLDGITFVDLDKDASVSALEGGEIDTFYQPRPADMAALDGADNITSNVASTSSVTVLRMRMDIEPFNDIRVYNAVKKCQDRQKILNLAWLGAGDLGADAHIAPSQPAYAPREIPELDIEGAMALMEEWSADTGNSLPLAVTLVTKNDDGEAEFAQVLKEQMDKAGFDVTLDITEAGGYWERWDEVSLGITAWTDRPLCTMLIPLAYVADAEGNPVPWNETRWVDDEFIEVFNEAAGTLDLEARRELVGKLQDIMLERAPIGIPYFKGVGSLLNSKVKNVPLSPNSYFMLHEVYMEE